MYALFLLSFVAEWAELDFLPTVAHRELGWKTKGKAFIYNKNSFYMHASADR